MSFPADGDRSNVFFYAEDEAEYYDLAEEFAQPRIDLIHDTMVDLVDYSLRRSHQLSEEQPLCILDVAAGTGAEAFRLLDRFDEVHVVAVDSSEPMLRLLRKKFGESYPGRSLSSCLTVINGDFFSERCTTDMLVSSLPGHLTRRRFDAVVAGFFLHHYPPEMKREFYRRAHAALGPQGVVVLAEVMAFESETLTRFAHDFGAHWIEKQFTAPDAYLLEKHAALGSDALRLRDLWLDHWSNAHVYAVDAVLSGGRKICQLEDVAAHADMALEAGFREVGIPFRFWEAGILWAGK
jgi:ubiquinone/menaquinone biosynthesis C-methylase UbiE